MHSKGLLILRHVKLCRMYRLYIQEASTFVLKIFIPIGDKNRYKKTNYDNQFLILFLFLKKKKIEMFYQ